MWFIRKLRIAMILDARSYQSNLSNYAKINNFFLMKKQLNLIFLFCFLLQHFIVHYKKSLLICKSMCLIVNEEVSWLLKPKRQYWVPRNFNKGTENRQWKCIQRSKLKRPTWIWNRSSHGIISIRLIKYNSLKSG